MIGSPRAGAAAGIRNTPFAPGMNGAAVAVDQVFSRVKPVVGNGNLAIARSRRAHAHGSNQRRYFEFYQEALSVDHNENGLIFGPAGLTLNSGGYTLPGSTIAFWENPGTNDRRYMQGVDYGATNLVRGNGSRIGVAVVLYSTMTHIHLKDLDAGTWYPANPDTSAGYQMDTFPNGEPMYFYFGARGNISDGTKGWRFNTGQSPFVGTLPAGTLAWR